MTKPKWLPVPQQDQSGFVPVKQSSVPMGTEALGGSGRSHKQLGLPRIVCDGSKRM